MDYMAEFEKFFENYALNSFVIVMIIWGTIFLLLLLFGILTAVIASKKGRNGFGWFLIGLFTGLMGLAVALAMLPKKYYTGEDDD